MGRHGSDRTGSSYRSNNEDVIDSNMILNQFDYNKIAVINPRDLVRRRDDMPKVAVTCFSRATFDRMIQTFGGKKVTIRSLANLDITVYETLYKDAKVALFLSPVGAPACALLLEDIFALGVEKVVMFGTCGVLDKSIEDCSIIIPASAVRDEGTSYHYVPATDEIKVNPKYTEEFIELLDGFGCSYSEGKTWTTDAFYRETSDKMKARKSQGCICVDMECSAVAAVARFRGKEVFQFFYAADNLDAEQWDMRSLDNRDKLDEKDKVSLLAMELAVKIEKEGCDR